MSLPATYNLTIYQGQTYTQIIVWTAGPGLAGAYPNQTPPVGSTPIPVDSDWLHGDDAVSPIPKSECTFVLRCIGGHHLRGHRRNHFAFDSVGGYGGLHLV